MRNTVVFIPLVLALALLTWYVVHQQQQQQREGLTTEEEKEYVDCEQEDEYVDCIQEETGGQSSSTKQVCDIDLQAIVRELKAYQGQPATVVEPTMQPIRTAAAAAAATRGYFGPASSSRRKKRMGYAEALRSFYADLKESVTLTPSYDEIRILLADMDDIIRLSKQENQLGTLQVFETMKQYLIALTQFDDHNPHTFLMPTTDKWQGFVTTNSM